MKPYDLTVEFYCFARRISKALSTGLPHSQKYNVFSTIDGLKKRLIFFLLIFNILENVIKYIPYFHDLTA